MIFVANYKMNGDKDFYQKVNKVFNKGKFKDTIVLCPPFVYMPFFKIKNKNVKLGSQDIAFTEDKKSTGQTSAKMLKEFGCSYCIIGHSERRTNGESDEMVASKVKYAQENGLIPIVCVGEQNKTSKLEVLSDQVKLALSQKVNKEIIFAYEPVWAIGSGEVPTNNKINKDLKIIKETANEYDVGVKVLYGGSVNLKNYKDLKQTNADGFLMGGISLKINEFLEVVKG